MKRISNLTSFRISKWLKIKAIQRGSNQLNKRSKNPNRRLSNKKIIEILLKMLNKFEILQDKILKSLFKAKFLAADSLEFFSLLN